jgi:NSS family neurotransmitter:Na+ symporter
MLSFYSVVAGWACFYTFKAIQAIFPGQESISAVAFGSVEADPTINLVCHFLFMGLTMLLVIGGVKNGIERASKILMPMLFLMLLYLLFIASQMSGFDEARKFVFDFKDGNGNWKSISPHGVLEALGHSFFTLSLGMGAMITYGSYMSSKSSTIKASVAICGLDTGIALIACLILFPITFSIGLKPIEGPGLVFINIPKALAETQSSPIIAAVFFSLLVFAALTSAISLLEVVCSYFIDQWKMSRKMAVLICGGAIFLVGIPSALSGIEGTFKGAEFVKQKAEIFGPRLGKLTKENWFDMLNYFVSNWMLPLGGLLISIFMAWRVRARVREAEFGAHIGFFYSLWFFLLAVVIPFVVIIVMLNAGGVLGDVIDKLIEGLHWLKSQLGAKG